MEVENEKKSADVSGASRKKTIGVKVDEQIWRQFRALAISQGKTAGELLDELMREYVGRSRFATPNDGSPDQ
jgi:hypothetical protein